MKLYELLKDYPILDFSGSAHTEISQIVYDSRRVLEGSLFVCLVGENLDGHDYLIEAFNRKVSAVLIQTELSPEVLAFKQAESPDTAIITVADTREALAFVSCNFYPFNLEQLKLHLLIGELGKGSCSHMLYHLLCQLKKQVSLIDDMQILSVGKKRYLPRNHPEMTDICAALSELQEGAVLLPFSYKDLSLKRGRFLAPNTCTLLHANCEEFRLAISLGAKDCFYLINADALEYDAKAELSSLRKRCLTYGIESTADIRARELRIETQGQSIGTRFIVDYPDGQSHSYFVALPGRHQVYNALSLLAWAYYKQLDMEFVKDYLSKLNLPGYSEWVISSEKSQEDFTLLIDRAWSPAQMKSLLQSLRPYCRGKLLLLASAAGDRSSSLRQELAQIAVRYADYVVFTVSNSRSEGAFAILENMTEHLKLSDSHFKCMENRKEAIAHIVSMAQPNDLVILSGKANEGYHIDAHSTEPFSEYDVALAALQERAGKH